MLWNCFSSFFLSNFIDCRVPFASILPKIRSSIHRLTEVYDFCSFLYMYIVYGCSILVYYNIQIYSYYVLWIVKWAICSYWIFFEWMVCRTQNVYHCGILIVILEQKSVSEISWFIAFIVSEGQDGKTVIKPA